MLLLEIGFVPYSFDRDPEGGYARCALTCGSFPTFSFNPDAVYLPKLGSTPCPLILGLNLLNTRAERCIGTDTGHLEYM